MPVAPTFLCLQTSTSLKMAPNYFVSEKKDFLPHFSSSYVPGYENQTWMRKMHENISLGLGFDDSSVTLGQLILG